MRPVVNFVTLEAKRETVLLPVMGLQLAATTTELSSIDHGNVGSQGLVLRPFALRLFYTPLYQFTCLNLRPLILGLTFRRLMSSIVDVPQR